MVIKFILLLFSFQFNVSTFHFIVYSVIYFQLYFFNFSLPLLSPIKEYKRINKYLVIYILHKNRKIFITSLTLN